MPPPITSTASGPSVRSIRRAVRFFLFLVSCSADGLSETTLIFSFILGSLAVAAAQIRAHALEDIQQQFLVLLADAACGLGAVFRSLNPDLLQDRLGLGGVIKANSAAVRRVRATLDPARGFHAVDQAGDADRLH